MKKEIIETIDCTPTWESLVDVMLEAYKKGIKLTQSDLSGEFKKMARAADKWNAYINGDDIKKAKLKDLQDMFDMGMLEPEVYNQKVREIKNS